MTLVRDAALASGVLYVVLLAGLVTSARFAPGALLVGFAGGLALEALTVVRPALVSRAWEHPLVRWGTFGTAIGLVGLAVFVLQDLGLNVLAGGVLAYLALVALVAAGVLPPTTEWRG